jgi:hypothetical protein
MKAAWWGIWLGGVLPAVLFGLCGAIQKLSLRFGIAQGWYLVCLGLAVTTVGGCWLVWFPTERQVSWAAGAWAALVGVLFGLGVTAIGYTIDRLGVPVAKLVSIYNANTLVTVALGFWWFGEAQHVDALKLLAGALFIVFGGTLAATS